MPTKSFSLVASKETYTGVDKQLVVEAGISHIAILVQAITNKTILAFELYEFSETEEKDVAHLYSTINAQSYILQEKYDKTLFFANSRESVLVPVSKFSKNIAEDYINLVHGIDNAGTVLYDYVEGRESLMNVFRIRNKWFDVFKSAKNISFHHSYSSVVKSVADRADNTVKEAILLQFFPGCFTAVVTANNKLQLVQTYIYRQKENVLYHLNNLRKQFQLSWNIKVEVSGIIDADFQLYREIIKYFSNVVLKEHNISTSLPDIKQHPDHYFVPFFNLTA